MEQMRKLMKSLIGDYPDKYLDEENSICDYMTLNNISVRILEDAVRNSGKYMILFERTIAMKKMQEVVFSHYAKQIKWTKDDPLGKDQLHLLENRVLGYSYERLKKEFHICENSGFI